MITRLLSAPFRAIGRALLGAGRLVSGRRARFGSERAGKE
jgi:hypothetical protein